ncbi:bifunctional phosphoribosylaminoimidazolecarboxamide formyltransferase/IMP cyclohydrolase [Salinibacillus aidingensis]|uniref:Bifunctional purine biosynthesis protein PurH n=1 Tax=Salinibacillus aidingensis TaxID=237684 RepID=A0ABP3LP82_9BACI
MRIKRALLSVSDKEGIVEFARMLSDNGIELVSTGGTKKLLDNEGIPVVSVEEVTGSPEILDGRVKTLHPTIHGGILARRDQTEHMGQLQEQNIQLIDLIVVNLYPFKKTILRGNVTEEEVIENIDIGGPTMLRAAAKNARDVTVVVDPNDYQDIGTEIQEHGAVSPEKRRRLAAKVFRHTAHYDALISQYLSEQVEEHEPDYLTLTYEKKQDLRYGENPHQQAAFYKHVQADSSSIANAEQLHGKELSFNNIQDADSALGMVREFQEPAVVAVKHTNPCGVGTGETLDEAWKRAYEADPVSIFGGIVALNRNVDERVAKQLSEIFLEIILAPSFSEEALSILQKKKNIRLLTADFSENQRVRQLIKSVRGGLLVQEEDVYSLEQATIHIPTKRKPTDEEWADLKLAWQVVKHVKSNAILLVKDQKTIGVGAGQMNRVGAAEIAIKQAGESAEAAVMASDAFFPMDDTVEAAAQAGIRAIIQPGGSIRDEDSIKKCDEYGIAMVFTGVRHFKH